jgi:hypothetical protein
VLKKTIKMEIPEKLKKRLEVGSFSKPDLEFEEGHESVSLLRKMGSTPANYGSMRPGDKNLLESTADTAA